MSYYTRHWVALGALGDQTALLDRLITGYATTGFFNALIPLPDEHINPATLPDGPNKTAHLLQYTYDWEKAAEWCSDNWGCYDDYGSTLATGNPAFPINRLDTEPTLKRWSGPTLPSGMLTFCECSNRGFLQPAFDTWTNMGIEVECYYLEEDIRSGTYINGCTDKFEKPLTKRQRQQMLSLPLRKMMKDYNL